ncbi:MAG: hypothetical protein LIR40_14145 [Bacteroidota bacterium]|nr:hypothetical protein [Bacteroidota bacterium]
MSNLLGRTNVKYPSEYGRELTIDDAKNYLSKEDEEIRVLETPISFIRDTQGRKYHETMKYYSSLGFTYARLEDGSAWGGFHPGYTAEFEDGTIWKAPKIHPGKAFFDFMEERLNGKTVTLQDDDEDFVV